MHGFFQRLRHRACIPRCIQCNQDMEGGVNFGGEYACPNPNPTHDTGAPRPTVQICRDCLPPANDQLKAHDVLGPVQEEFRRIFGNYPCNCGPPSKSIIYATFRAGYKGMIPNPGAGFSRKLERQLSHQLFYDPSGKPCGLSPPTVDLPRRTVFGDREIPDHSLSYLAEILPDTPCYHGPAHRAIPHPLYAYSEEQHPDFHALMLGYYGTGRMGSGRQNTPFYGYGPHIEDHYSYSYEYQYHPYRHGY